MAPKKKRKEMKHSNIICLRLSDIELELVNHAASQEKPDFRSQNGNTL